MDMMDSESTQPLNDPSPTQPLNDPSPEILTLPNPNTNISHSTDPSPSHHPSMSAPCPAGTTPMVSQQYMVMIQNPSGMVPDFNVRGALMTAHLQIICGSMSVLLGIIGILIKSEDAYIGAPIWTGLFFFISAGLTGAWAAKRKQNCLITGYLVLSVLSAVAAFQLLSLMASFTAWEFGAFYSSAIFRGRVAVDAMTAVIALLELGVSIVASVISCRGTCFQTNPGPSTTVQYLPALPSNGTAVQQNEHGSYIQSQPIQLMTCSPGQTAYQLQACALSQPCHQPPSPQAHKDAVFLPPYTAAAEEDPGLRTDFMENEEMSGMEKVPLV